MWLASLCLFTTPLARRCSRTLQEILWGKKQVLFSWGKNDQSCSFVCLNCFAHIVRSSPPFASKSSSMVSRNMRNEKQRWPCSGNVWRRPSQRTRKWAWRLWKSSCWKRSGWDISMGVGGRGGKGGLGSHKICGHEGCGRLHAGKEAGETLAWGWWGGGVGLGSHKICGHEGCGRVHAGKEAGETLAWGLGEGGGTWKSQDLWAWRLWKSACWKRSVWDISMGVGRGGLGSHKICGHEGKTSCWKRSVWDCGRVHAEKEAGETLAWGRAETGAWKS